jgi:type I restriction enzyme, S subunit
MNKFVEFGQVAEFRNGLNFSKDHYGKGCLLIGVSDFKDNFSPQYDNLKEINPDGVSKDDDYLKNKDLLFVRSNGNKALVGRSLYITKNIKALYSGFCIRARLTSDEIDPLFLAYYTKSKYFKQFIAYADGTNINNLNQDILSSVKIPHYSKNVQRNIASCLLAIDKKIEFNNQINSELEAMAKLIYDYWFVQFDFPDENGKPYKSSGGKMVFNEDLNREIPEGWNSIPISSLLNIKTGKEDANFATDDGKYPFFTCAEKILSCDDYAFEGKAVLLAGNGTFGIKRYVGKFNAYQRTYVLIPNEESHFPHVYYAVKAQAQQLTDGARGSIVKFITIGDIENINLVLPSNPSVCSTELLNNLFDQSDALINENEELTRLRDWLLPMLMNGQVTVSEAS